MALNMLSDPRDRLFALAEDMADGLNANHGPVGIKQVVGVDADFVAVLSVTESDATLTGLSSGATVKVRVTAVNAAGESQPSTEVQIVVP